MKEKQPSVKKLIVFLKTHDKYKASTTMSIDCIYFSVIPGFLRIVTKEDDSEVIKLIPMNEFYQAWYYDRNGRKVKSTSRIHVELTMKPIYVQEKPLPDNVKLNCDELYIYPDSIVEVENSPRSGITMKVYAAHNILIMQHSPNKNVFYFKNDATIQEGRYSDEQCTGKDF